MKKLLLLLASFCLIHSMAQTSVKIKTSKDTGDEFSVVVNSGLECVVDWGDGKNDTIITTLEPLCGTVAGRYITIKANGLTYLDCSNQMVSQLTFTACGGLETLIASNNKIITLNISALTSLKTLWIDGNLLTALDLSKAPNIESVMAGNNMISKLTRPAEGLTELADFWINKNRFTTLDLSQSKKIQTLNVENNKLTKMTLSPLSGKAQAAFIEGNSLDFTSLWNKISVAKWYGMTQNVSFAQSTYNVGEEFSLDRNLFTTNQEGVNQAATQYSFNWYPYLFGVKGEKLTRGTEASTNCDYTTPSTSDKKGVFTFKRAFDDVQLEIKNNKYLNFLLVSDHISIEDPSAVGDAKTANSLRINALQGAVVIEAEQPADVKIYDVAGALRWQGSVQNSTRIPLGKGVFIINNKKVTL